MNDFMMDVAELRIRAKRHMEEGAVTEGYQANREKVIELLETALATEWVCVLRYRQHEVVAEGIHAEAVAKEFAQHATEELAHALQLAKRIKQLGGHPSLDPSTLQKKSHSEYKESDSLWEMIRENLFAERIAVESYSEMIRYIGEGDPTTRRMLEEILAKEEEHADEMAGLLKAVDPKESPEDGKH